MEIPEVRNSEDTVEREPDGTFVPGKSPNPGGQAKWLKDVKASLRGCAPLAAQVLKEVMEDGSHKDKTAAARVVLEYTVPKPKQTHRVEGKGGDPLAVLTPEALVAFVTGKKGP